MLLDSRRLFAKTYTQAQVAVHVIDRLLPFGRGALYLVGAGLRQDTVVNHERRIICNWASLRAVFGAGTGTRGWCFGGHYRR